MTKGVFLTRVLVLIGMVIALTACTHESYESGESDISFLRADFGMIHTVDSAKADHALLDDGHQVVFPSPVTVPWAKKKNTFYRALVYYNTRNSTVFKLSPVLILPPLTPEQSPNLMIRDPLEIESLWWGGDFLNITCLLKTGVADHVEQSQNVALVQDSVRISGDGHKTYYLHMAHQQGGVPQYYTVKGYISMPLTPEMQGATIKLSVTTYHGERHFEMQAPSL